MGGTVGNTNKRDGLRWSNAIQRAINAYPEKPESLYENRGLDKAAYAFVTKMMTDSEIAFFKEFGDRTDGKAVQPLDIDANVKTHEMSLDELDRERDQDSQAAS